jgi:hypothetical protein
MPPLPAASWPLMVQRPLYATCSPSIGTQPKNATWLVV